MIYLLLWWWNSVRNGLENNVLEGVEGSKEGEKEGTMMEIKEKGRSRASPPTLVSGSHEMQTVAPNVDDLPKLLSARRLQWVAFGLHLEPLFEGRFSIRPLLARRQSRRPHVSSSRSTTLDWRLISTPTRESVRRLPSSPASLWETRLLGKFSSSDT